MSVDTDVLQKKKAARICGRPLYPTGLFADDIGLQDLKDLIQSSVSMDVQVDGFGKIQAEDTHDGLGIDYVSAGYQIEICIKLCKIIYERLYLINGI